MLLCWIVSAAGGGGRGWSVDGSGKKLNYMRASSFYAPLPPPLNPYPSEFTAGAKLL